MTLFISADSPNSSEIQSTFKESLKYILPHMKVAVAYFSPKKDN